MVSVPVIFPAKQKVWSWRRSFNLLCFQVTEKSSSESVSRDNFPVSCFCNILTGPKFSCYKNRPIRHLNSGQFSGVLTFLKCLSRLKEQASHVWCKLACLFSWHVCSRAIDVHTHILSPIRKIPTSWQSLTAACWPKEDEITAENRNLLSGELHNLYWSPNIIR